MTLGFDVMGQIVTTPAKTLGGMFAKAAMIRRLMEPMQPRWADGDDFDQTTRDPLV